MSTSLMGLGSLRPSSKSYRLAQIPRMDEASMGLRASLFPHANRLSSLASGDDESQFEALEKPAYEGFQRALGQIGSRYAGVGAGQMSSRNSSAFQNETTGAAGDLAARLQSQRMDLQRGALNDLMGLSELLLGNQPYEQALIAPQPKRKWWQTLIGGGAPVAGALAGGLAGGPAGASLGLQAGSSFGSAFI